MHKPDDALLEARLSAVDPVAYAANRNHLGGAVTGLSPWVTHGCISIPELIERFSLTGQDMLAFQLGWRAFFQHVWGHLGDGILADIRPGLPGIPYADTLPADIREGHTGIPVVDRAVATLYATGTLHNHARLWLASYVVHVRKVHWRPAADWLYAHLLDGDLASNHLSWQWVAATFSSKPYLFNAENVARFAPADWHSGGFESLDEAAFARLAGLGCEILILGTGMKQRFPHPSLMKSLMAARIGLEVMDLGSACRTYNILVAEHRNVAAALLFDPA